MFTCKKTPKNETKQNKTKNPKKQKTTHPKQPPKFRANHVYKVASWKFVILSVTREERFSLSYASGASTYLSYFPIFILSLSKFLDLARNKRL